MVQAIAQHSAFSGGGRSQSLLFKNHPDDWGRVDTSDPLWITGDLTYTYKEYGSGDRITARHFDVRFEPNGIHNIVATVSRPPESRDSVRQNEAANETVSKGPPVSDDHLWAWFEVYKRVYTGSADTEAMALKSATGMFPGKSVTREKIRALRGDGT